MWIIAAANPIGPYIYAFLCTLSMVSAMALSVIKVFRYSFSEAVPIFFNRLKSGFFLVRWLWIEICENVVLSKIDVTMTIINKKL